MTRTAIIVTGLPASGKSTVGKRLARSLDFDFLDKDDFLVKLFECHGIGDLAWRQRLSRKSDVHFEKVARTCRAVVLVSHWRPLNNKASSGTPTEWLKAAFDQVIEVYCDCPVNVAVSRFVERTRHQGHCDQEQTRQQVCAKLTGYSQHLPLGVGSVITTDTSGAVDIEAVLAEVRQLPQ